MPNLPAHTNLAFQVARLLRHPTLESHMGHFLLGATSPDIRVITRKRREEYHFAQLDFGAIGTGMQGLFEAHPHLLSPVDHDGPTQAFVAGYITHLIVDETWIVEMYRRFFGNREVFQNPVVGNVMDRALQLELDRQSWQTLGAARTELEAASDGVCIEFIPPETLDEWRVWVIKVFDREFSWDRLRFMARRIARGNREDEAHRLAEEFARAAPESLERLYDSVPRNSLESFRQQAIDRLVSVLGGSLP